MVSVYDADTIRVDISLGLGVWIHNEPLRLYGINAPEVKGEERVEGLMSRDALKEMLPEGTVVRIQTIKDNKGKFGRYLAIVWVDGNNINEWLVENGHAVRKEY